MVTLTPLFSPECELVGWMQPQKYIFDPWMGYVAFVTNGHAWSARSGRWIGPIAGLHAYDTEGRPVAWNPTETLRGLGKPLRPVNVVRAITPVRPAMPLAPIVPHFAPNPLGGWSPLSFAGWLIANDPEPADIVESVAPETGDEIAASIGEIEALPGETSEDGPGGPGGGEQSSR